MSKRRSNEPVIGSFDTALNKAVDSLTLMDHQDMVQGLFNRVGLDAYYDYYVEHGQQPRLRDDTGPVYHGQTHTFQVALNCYEGGLYSGVSNKELRTLMVAGLFHDARHTRGIHGDMVNIDNALRCLHAAHALAPEHQRLKPEEYEEAKGLIRLTEFPYKAKKTTSALGRILRDADMMGLYTSDTDTLTDLFLGLFAEGRTSWDHRNRYLDSVEPTLANFAAQQKSFGSLLEWNTSWGKIKAFKRNWPQAGRRLQLVLQHAQRKAE